MAKKLFETEILSDVCFEIMNRIWRFWKPEETQYHCPSNTRHPMR